jgi:segregation and condensation protein B
MVSSAQKQLGIDSLIDATIAYELPLASQIECLLFVSGEAVSITDLALALNSTTIEIEAVLDALVESYHARGIRLQRISNKVQLVTAPEMAKKIHSFLKLEITNKLSTAALETLAIIAYRQPITKPQLEMLRGVNCDGVIHTLIARSLIQELGRADTVGKPMAYGVTSEFLQYFGLPSLQNLPDVNKLDIIDTVAPIAKLIEPSEDLAQLRIHEDNSPPN